VYQAFPFICNEWPSRSGLTACCVELAGFIPGKNLAYYDGYEADHVAAAHELLQTTIQAEEIPFDGVVGYSQGASLAISYLIQQQIEHPNRPPPF